VEISKFETSSIVERNKAVTIIEQMNNETISMEGMKKQIFSGVPESYPGLRPIAWRVILGSLPLETEAW
jgi:hypothetical protein